MEMGLCRAAWRSIVSFSGGTSCCFSKKTMRLSQKVLTVSLFAVGGFGLVYVMLFNVLPPVFHTSQPQHILTQTPHRDPFRDLARPPGPRGGAETGKEEAPADSPGLQGGDRSSAEGGKGAGGAASQASEIGAVLVEVPLKDEKKKKKEEEEEEDRPENTRDTVSGAREKLQGQRTEADRAEGVPDDQKKGADRVKDLPGDQRKGANKAEELPGGQKTGADRAKEVPGDQKKGADSAEETLSDQKTGADRDKITPQKDADRAEKVLQDQRKGADSSREVGQGQKQAGQEEDVTDQKKTVSEGRTVPQNTEKGHGKETPDQTQTSDHWPVFSKDYFPKHIPPSPFRPNFTIRWDFNTSAFLQRQDVKDQPPKLITWVVKTRYMTPLPEPVRLRVCPEMPCRLTTNQAYRKDSAALLWAGQIMRDPKPPVRSHPDQVFVFHNHEPQTPDWIFSPSFRKPAWKSAFNWTMHYRSDSDIVSLYGLLAKREEKPVSKNYTDIVARKSKLAAWMVSHCLTHGRRETYVDLLEKHMAVDAYGECSKKKCPRNQDDSCFRMISKEYKFFLAFENAFCTDYISEKFFRYLGADTVVVARGSNQYRKHAPPGIFINTADFKSPKELADYLLHLDRHPEDYIQLLKAKDSYQPLYEDWPIRAENGQIRYMHYHYESVSYCEMCRRLWNLEKYRKTIPDIGKWFDKENCHPPNDVV